MTSDDDLRQRALASMDAMPDEYRTVWYTTEDLILIDVDRIEHAEDGAYIAAASPATILALLDRLAQAETDATALRAAIERALQQAEFGLGRVVRELRAALGEEAHACPT